MINIQNDLEINININDRDIIILNKEIKEIYNCWFEENEIRKLLFINDSFKDIISIDEKIKLLKDICDGENLNFDELKHKYLNEKEKKYIKEKIDIIKVSTESLLDTFENNGHTYFYENKEDGIIYDKKTNKSVGIIKNGEPIFE
jgi:hypothetical protein